MRPSKNVPQPICLGQLFRSQAPARTLQISLHTYPAAQAGGRPLFFLYVPSKIAEKTTLFRQAWNGSEFTKKTKAFATPNMKIMECKKISSPAAGDAAAPTFNRRYRRRDGQKSTQLALLFRLTLVSASEDTFRKCYGKNEISTHLPAGRTDMNGFSSPSWVPR